MQVIPRPNRDRDRAVKKIPFGMVPSFPNRESPSARSRITQRMVMGIREKLEEKISKPIKEAWLMGLAGLILGAFALLISIAKGGK